MSASGDVDAGGGYRIEMIGRAIVRGSDGTAAPLSPALSQLLSLLVAVGPAGATMDRLADDLWNEQLPATWAASLRMALSRLRPKLPDGALPVVGGKVRLALPTEEVDVWDLAERANAAQVERNPSVLNHLLHSPHVYPDAEVSPAIDDSLQRVAALQRTLISRLAREGHEPLSRELLVSLRLHAEADPLDKQLTHAVALAHATSGHAATGAQLLEANLQVRGETLGAEVDADSAALLRRLRAADLPAGGSTATPRRRVRMPSLLEQLAAEPVAGAFVPETVSKVTAVEHGSSRTVVIDGQSGSGKTRLLAGIARALVERGVEVVYLPAVRETHGAYANVVAAMPAVGRLLDAVLSDPEPSAEARRSAIWTHVLAELQQRARGRAIAVLFDDAQWLDSQEQDLARFLARAQLADGISVAVAGRRDGQDRGWIQLRDDLLGLPHAELIEPIDLDLPTMEELVTVLRPDIEGSGRTRLAQQLVWASDGVVGVARALLGWIESDQATFRVDVNDGQVTSLGRQLELRLDERQLAFASACSVEGLEFSLYDAARLAMIDEAAALHVIDDLVEAGVLAETSAPGMYRFAHLLVAEAAFARLSRSEARELHARAAEAAVNLHRRARHLVGALPLVETAVAATALAESARRHAQRDLHWEAVEDLELLRETCGGDLSPAQRVLFAGSLARIGRAGPAAEQRLSAFEDAVLAGDWALAFEAVSAGLPEAEALGGENDRIELAKRLLTYAGLPERVERRANTLIARQAAYAGLQDETLAAIDRLEAALGSGTPQVALAQRQVLAHTRPEQRLAALERIDWSHEATAEEAMTAELFMAIDHFEAGDPDRARVAHHRVMQESQRLSEPMRQWHGLLFESLFSFNEGDWESFHDAVEQAHQFAYTYGIAGGPSARRAQLMLSAWVSDSPAFASVELSFKAGKILALEAAGRALVADARGDLDVARSLLSETLVTLRSSSYPSRVSTAALVADLAHRVGSPNDARLLRSILEPRRGTASVVGAGLASLGPVDRYIGLLCDDPDQRRGHLETASELARHWKMPLWESINSKDAAAIADQ